MRVRRMCKSDSKWAKISLFSCRTKSAAALGTTFGLLLLLLLLLSVISKIFVNSISSCCNYGQFCFYLELLGISIAQNNIAQHQHCLAIALLKISITQHQHCLAIALLSNSIAQHLRSLETKQHNLFLTKRENHNNNIKFR